MQNNPEAAQAIKERTKARARVLRKQRKAERLELQRTKKFGFPKQLQQVYTAVFHTAPTDSCISFTGSISDIGYGLVSVDGRTTPAHRLALELKLGRKLMPGMETLHSCNVRNCINPAHLREGTHKENMEQASAEGRMAAHNRRIFSLEEVETIRKRLAQGEFQFRIAEELNVSPTTISYMANGRTYRENYIG
jgi:hypothetical protein